MKGLSVIIKQSRKSVTNRMAEWIERRRNGCPIRVPGLVFVMAEAESVKEDADFHLSRRRDLS